MKNTNNNQPILGFWSYSNEFLIGEYFPAGGCTMEFELVKTVFGFQAYIPHNSFSIVLNPKLEKLWCKTKNITSMRDMESYLINIGLIKCN